MGISQGSWVSNRFSAPKYITTFDGTSPVSSEKGRFAFYSWEAFYEYVLACPRRVSLDGVDGTGIYRVDAEKRKVKFDFEGASHAGYSVALFRDDYRKKENLLEVYAIGVDVDRTLMHPDYLRDILREIGWGCIWHTTASDALGEGLRSYRLFFPTENPISDVGVYAECWEDIAVTLRGKGVDCDAGAKDASRFWWWPARLVEHPDAYQAEIIAGTGLYDPATRRRGGVGKAARAHFPIPDNADNADKPGGSGDKQGSFTFRTVLEMAQEIRRAGPGELNNVMNRVAFTCGGAYSAGRYERGLTPEQVIDTLLEAVMASPGQRDKSDGQERQKILQSWTAGSLRPMHSDRVPPNHEGGGSGFGGGGHVPSWKDELKIRITKEGFRKGDPGWILHNLNLIFEHDEEAPYCKRIVLNKMGGKHALLAEDVAAVRASGDLSQICKDLEDSHVRQILPYLEREYGIHPTVEDRRTTISNAAERRPVHPFLDHVDTLQWDGVPRIDTWLSVYGGAEDTAYVRDVGRIFFMQAISRQRVPGCQADCMVILEGLGGIGKSTSLLELSYGLYMDDVDLDDKFTDLSLSEKLIVEMSELNALKKSESTQAKKMISRRSATVRKVYHEYFTDIKRSCVIVGTTNEVRGEYLKDPTGNRRYLPVVVTRMDVAGIVRDRDQLWAEADARYKSGERIWMYDENLVAAEAEQAARMHIDPWTEQIAAYLMSQTEVTFNQLCERGLEIREAPKRGSVEWRRITHIVGELGWETKQIKKYGATIRVYSRKSVSA